MPLQTKFSQNNNQQEVAPGLHRTGCKTNDMLQREASRTPLKG